jgi:hypothetical protein
MRVVRWLRNAVLGVVVVLWLAGMLGGGGYLT